MASLPNLTRADVAKPIHAFVTDGNSLKFKYILPTSSIGRRSVIIQDLRHARMTDSLLAQQLMEDGYVKEVTLGSVMADGSMRDVVIVEYKDGVSAALGRPQHEQTYLNFAANVKADGTLANPKLSLWPVEKPLPGGEELAALAMIEFDKLKTENPNLPLEKLGRMAVVKSAVDIFASRTSHAHGGDISIVAYPENNNGTVRVQFTHACVACKSGRENTRTNMEKMMPTLSQGLVNKVLVV